MLKYSRAQAVKGCFLVLTFISLLGFDIILAKEQLHESGMLFHPLMELTLTCEGLEMRKEQRGIRRWLRGKERRSRESRHWAGQGRAERISDIAGEGKSS